MKAILLILFACTAFAEPSYITFPSDIEWMTKSSPHFDVIYRKGQDAFSERALKSAERAYRLLTPIFPEAPERTWIVLADFHDSTNGYALNFPYSHIVLFATSPATSGQLSSLDDWFDSLVLHEYVHILHLYPAHGIWKPMRTIFGTWVVPNGMMPSHLHEGIATFLETELSEGGRGKSPQFKMYRRMAIEAGTWGSDFTPLDKLDGTIRDWPHGASAYFFGEALYRELWSRKGRQGIYDLTLHSSDNWPYISVNLPAREVFGQSYEQVWQELYSKLNSDGKKEIAAIKQTPLSKTTPLTTTKYRKLDLTLSPKEDKIAFRSDSPYQNQETIQIFDLKTKKEIDSIALEPDDAEGICWGTSQNEEWLIYNDTILKNNYAINQPTILSLKTKKTRTLPLKNVHAIACNGDLSKIAVYAERAGAGKVFTYQYNVQTNTLTPTQVWEAPKGAWVTSLVYSNALYFSLHRSAQSDIYEWNNSAAPSQRLTVPGHLYSLRRDSASNNLLGVASLDGREEVWAFSLNDKTATKRIGVLGGVNSFVKAGTQYYVSEYTHGGYDIAEASAVASHAVTVQSHPSPVKQEESTSITEEKSYSPSSTLFPRAWLPSVLFVPDGLQFGAYIPWFDLSQKHFYSLFGGYDTRGTPFGQLNYNYRFGTSSMLDWNAYYFPSYIRSLTTFIKRWGGSVGVAGTIGSFPPVFRLAFNFQKQDPSSIAPESQSLGTEVDISYQFGFPLRRLSISPVNGMRFNLGHAQYFKELGSTQDYFVSTAKIDSYLEAPWWKESVLYLSTKAGYTEGTYLFNSYFDGGGEVLLSQSRGTYLNRGFLNGAFIGRRIFNANLEYCFPIAWIERGFSYLPVHLKVIHAALVFDATSYDNGNSPTGIQNPNNIMKTFYSSAGLELRSDWKFFFYLPASLRAGIYHGINGPDAQDIQLVLGMDAQL